ncbi:hypothetical protein [Psychrobacillus sp. FSL K6-1464]|uniref:hypothetical protein n=1 Tax=Psychrobacillus sp. FSL K6-1464 TaxID=2921545 RepID=UPI0030FC3CBB
MKKRMMSLGLLLLFSLSFISGCNSEEKLKEKEAKEEAKQKEEAVLVDEIRFDKDYNVYIETVEGTMVARRLHTDFIRVKNTETTVYSKWKVMMNGDKVFATVFLSEKDMKTVSKKYAETYKETLKIEEELSVSQDN